MEYQSLGDLELINKNDWKIRVRLARKWNDKQTLTATVNGVHLLLIDEYVSKERSFLLFKIYCNKIIHLKQ